MKNRQEIFNKVKEVLRTFPINPNASDDILANKIADRLDQFRDTTEKMDKPRMMVCSLDDGTCSHSKPHLENSYCQTHHKCIPVESATAQTTRIKVVKCSSGGFWYQACVNDLFDVVEYSDKSKWQHARQPLLLFEKCDCEIVRPVESAKLLVTSCSTCENNGKEWLGCMDCKGEKWSPRKCDRKDRQGIKELTCDNNAYLASKLNEVIRKVNKMEEGGDERHNQENQGGGGIDKGNTR